MIKTKVAFSGRPAFIQPIRAIEKVFKQLWLAGKKPALQISHFCFDHVNRLYVAQGRFLVHLNELNRGCQWAENVRSEIAFSSLNPNRNLSAGLSPNCTQYQNFTLTFEELVMIRKFRIRMTALSEAVSFKK